MQRLRQRVTGKVVLLLAALVLVTVTRAGAPAEVSAQPAPVRGPARWIELRALDERAGTRVVPPRALAPASTNAANITVTYTGFTPQAQAAFEYAVSIWEGLITSPVDIHIDAEWKPLGAGVLGSAGALSVCNPPGAPQANTCYPDALANRFAGTDLYPGDPEISASFSSTFNFYLGTDGNPGADQHDFVSVVLHEIGHGLGFSGSATMLGGGVGRLGIEWQAGVWYPKSYDRFVQNGAGQDLISAFTSPSADLGAQLISNDLYFNGPLAKAANGNQRPRLYAPGTWSGGSSYSHLDEGTYGAGNQNSLMTPMLAKDEAIHSPGPITLGLFCDIGWVTPSCGPTGTIAGTVQLQGRTSSSPPGTGFGTGFSFATITINPGNVVVTANAMGAVTTPQLGVGSYEVTASAPGYLSARRMNVTVTDGQTTTLPSITLRAGKVDGDGTVNITDVTAIIAAFGSQPANRLDGQGRVVDVNGDGVVNIQDMSLTLGNFGRAEMQPWP